MSVALGKNVKIYSGSTGTSPIIALAKACTVSKKLDIVEKSSSLQSAAKEFIGGRYEWDVSINHLIQVGSGTPFDSLIKVGQTYTLRVDISGIQQQGTAICIEADISGADGLATGSLKFKGTGELTTVTNS